MNTYKYMYDYSGEFVDNHILKMQAGKNNYCFVNGLHLVMSKAHHQQQNNKKFRHGGIEICFCDVKGNEFYLNVVIGRSNVLHPQYQTSLKITFHRLKLICFMFEV